MKKIFLFAALACIVFASCQKEEPVTVSQNEGQQEITFSALSKAMTKGVLGSGASFATTGDIRTINVAGVMKTADNSVVDFLEAKTFTYLSDGWKGVKPGTGAGTWVPDPVYYPLGGESKDYHFLAYSESNGIESIARWYGSSEVEIQVGEESAQNDIVYSDFIGNKSNAAAATFYHTQALVTVKIQTKTSGQTITINKIGFKDVKTSGTLNIKLDKSKVGTAESPSDPYASHKWIYNAGCNCACAEMGDYYLENGYTPGASTDSEKYAVKLGEESKFVDYNSNDNDKGYGVITNAGTIFDKLFPAQKVAAATMIVNYTLGNLTADVELALDGSATPAHASAKTWAASTRYVYNITVNPAEITINPTADAWEVDELNPGEYN